MVNLRSTMLLNQRAEGWDRQGLLAPFLVIFLSLYDRNRIGIIRLPIAVGEW